MPHPDGTIRRLYCLESPECWFEDFGAARLSNGRAQVDLDADFAALVHKDDYAVFLTPEGDCQGLYVASKSPTRFEVRELRGGTSSLPLSYRVVARRKDVVGPRLEKVVLPKPRGPEALVDPGIHPQDLPGLTSSPLGASVPSAPPPPTAASASNPSTTFGRPKLPPLANPTPTASPVASPSPTPTRPTQTGPGSATPTRTPTPSPTTSPRPSGR